MSFNSGRFKSGMLTFSIEAHGSSFDSGGTVGEGKIAGALKFDEISIKVNGTQKV